MRRVRWWVRLLAVAILLLMLAFGEFGPYLLNPDWRTGMPDFEQLWSTAILAVLGLIAWAAFRSRIELDGGQLRVVNPWGTRIFLASNVATVRPGSLGVEFVLHSGQVVVAFAVQTTLVHIGPEPRWVDVAQAVLSRS